MPPITPRQHEMLAAYALTGHVGEAADWCGISENHAKNALSDAYERLDVDGAFGAFRALDWLRVPPRAWPRRAFPFDAPPAPRRGWRRRKDAGAVSPSRVAGNRSDVDIVPATNGGTT